MRIKLDENLGDVFAAGLRSAGHDVATVPEERLSGAKDDAVFARCREEKRSLVTLDLDFSDPLRYPPDGGEGVIILRPPRPSFRLIVSLLEQMSVFAKSQSPREAIWIVEPGRVRIYKSP